MGNLSSKKLIKNRKNDVGDFKNVFKALEYNFKILCSDFITSSLFFIHYKINNRIN